jgi:hypothetical protein
MFIQVKQFKDSMINVWKHIPIVHAWFNNLWNNLTLYLTLIDTQQEWNMFHSFQTNVKHAHRIKMLERFNGKLVKLISACHELFKFVEHNSISQAFLKIVKLMKHVLHAKLIKHLFIGHALLNYLSNNFNIDLTSRKSEKKSIHYIIMWNIFIQGKHLKDSMLNLWNTIKFPMHYWNTLHSFENNLKYSRRTKTLEGFYVELVKHNHMAHELLNYLWNNILINCAYETTR